MANSPTITEKDNDKNMTINLYKLIFAMTTVICLTSLILAGKASEAGAFGIMGIIVGYILGNGVNAKSNTPLTGILNSKDEE